MVDDFEMSSPLIVGRMNEPSGTLRGKAAVRPYWALSVAAKPPLKFELLAVHVGVNRLGLAYRSVGRRFGLEILTLDAARRITHGVALYGDAPRGADATAAPKRASKDARASLTLLE